MTEDMEDDEYDADFMHIIFKIAEFIIYSILYCTPFYYAVKFSFTDGVVGFAGGLLFGVFIGLFYSLFAMAILIPIVIILTIIYAIFNIFN